MKSIKPVFLLVFIFCFNFLFGQTDLIVKLPKDYSQQGVIVTLKIDNLTQSSVTGLSDSIKFSIPKNSEISKMNIRYSAVGFTDKSWVGDFKLIGSNIIFADLKPNGSINLMQWPLVEFECIESGVDIELDGEILGVTSISKTVKPNVTHTFKWKKSGITKCEKSVKLTYNQSRKYTCNSNGSLSEN